MVIGDFVAIATFVVVGAFVVVATFEPQPANTRTDILALINIKAKSNFIVYAALLYGGSMFIGISIFTIFFNLNTMVRMTDYSIITIVFIFIAYAIILGVVGILLGIHIWNTQTREFDNK